MQRFDITNSKGANNSSDSEQDSVDSEDLISDLKFEEKKKLQQNIEVKNALPAPNIKPPIDSLLKKKVTHFYDHFLDHTGSDREREAEVKNLMEWAKQYKDTPDGKADLEHHMKKGIVKDCFQSVHKAQHTSWSSFPHRWNELILLFQKYAADYELISGLMLACRNMREEFFEKEPEQSAEQLSISLFNIGLANWKQVGKVALEGYCGLFMLRNSEDRKLNAEVEKMAVEYKDNGDYKDAQRLVRAFGLKGNLDTELHRRLNNIREATRVLKKQGVQAAEVFFSNVSKGMLVGIVEALFEQKLYGQALGILTRNKIQVNKKIQATLATMKELKPAENRLISMDGFCPPEVYVLGHDADRYIRLLDFGFEEKDVHVIDKLGPQFDAVTVKLLASPTIGVDAEFVGKKFCTLQIASRSTVAIFDIIELGKHRAALYRFLSVLFGNAKIEKVGHSFSSDVSVIRSFFKNQQIDFANVLEISKTFLEGKKASGLAASAKEMFGKEMSKMCQMSDWDRTRPLKKCQIHYAALDAVITLNIVLKLRENKDKRAQFIEVVNFAKHSNYPRAQQARPEAHHRQPRPHHHHDDRHAHRGPVSAAVADSSHYHERGRPDYREKHPKDTHAPKRDTQPLFESEYFHQKPKPETLHRKPAEEPHLQSKPQQKQSAQPNPSHQTKHQPPATTNGKLEPKHHQEYQPHKPAKFSQQDQYPRKDPHPAPTHTTSHKVDIHPPQIQHNPPAQMPRPGRREREDYEYYPSYRAEAYNYDQPSTKHQAAQKHQQPAKPSRRTNDQQYDQPSHPAGRYDYYVPAPSHQHAGASHHYNDYQDHGYYYEAYPKQQAKHFANRK